MCVCVRLRVDVEEVACQLIRAGLQMHHLSVDVSATPVGLLSLQHTDLNWSHVFSTSRVVSSVQR